MLDQFQRAHMNVVRVAESSWGNLETAPGKFNFGFLRDFLDDLHAHKMKAILGTSTYIAPQWLIASNPDMLRELQPGIKVHPMARKAACINNPVYRAACRRYIEAFGRAFKDHPAVIGWQLDNEIELLVGEVCYDAACNRAWHDWLEKTYRTPAELNRRLLLVSWGMSVDSFGEIPQVYDPGGVRMLPALRLANLHFRRDSILAFLAEQRETLREAGVKQWITTDWNDEWTAFADDPLASKAVGLAGLNFYQPSAEDPEYWRNLAWHLDMHRSALASGRFLVTETRAGVAGSTVMWDAFPTTEQFRMWMLHPLAYGASGLLYWSGNRWRGGHWPHWGGLLDWIGNPEVDFDSYIETGEVYQRLARRLLANPVKASAAIVTDFDQRAALEVYPHTPASKSVLIDAFDALHRLGIGVDAISVKRFSDPQALKGYKLVVIPAASALDDDSFGSVLKSFVERGGQVLITPFTAYQSWDGVFRGDGFGANLRPAVGAVVRTVRRMNVSPGEGGQVPQVIWEGLRGVPNSPVGADGFCEFLDVDAGTEVIARFETNERVFRGKPAATRLKIGKGSVIKLAFWPAGDGILHLLHQMLPESASLLASFLPPGVQAVPRQDGSLFVINTTNKPTSLQLAQTTSDVLSGRNLSGNVRLDRFGVLWLERLHDP
jgi:beta-galactosidase